MAIRKLNTVASRETYQGPDFAIIKPYDERQSEVWTYKENRKLGLYNQVKAEQVKEMYDKESAKKHLKEMRKKTKSTTSTKDRL